MKIQFLLLCIVCNSYSFANSFYKDTLYAKSVDFNILTNYQITCGNFEKNFNQRIKSRIIDSAEITSLLDSYLSKIKYARKNREIDVRAKFIYKKEDHHVSEIRTDGNEILINGRLIKQDDKFAQFLRKLVE